MTMSYKIPACAGMTPEQESPTEVGLPDLKRIRVSERFWRRERCESKAFLPAKARAYKPVCERLAGKNNEAIAARSSQK